MTRYIAAQKIMHIMKSLPSCFSDSYEALEMGAKALDEVDVLATYRTPIAPTYDKHCRNCGNFIYKSDNFCSKCGQAIDWTEVENDK